MTKASRPRLWPAEADELARLGGAGTPEPISASRSVSRVRDHMRETGIEVLLFSLGADLPWLTGYEAMPLERLTMLVLPADDQATLVVPDSRLPAWTITRRLFAHASLGRNEQAGRYCGGPGRSRTRARGLGPVLGRPPFSASASSCPGRAGEAPGGCRSLRAVKDAQEVVAHSRGCGRGRGRRALLARRDPLIGRTEAEVSAETLASGSGRRAPPCELRHCRKRAELGQPAPCGRLARDRSQRGRRL